MLKAFSRMKIAKKLPLIMVGLTAINVFAVTLLQQNLMYRETMRSTEKSLSAFQEAKKTDLQGYLQDIDNDRRSAVTWFAIAASGSGIHLIHDLNSLDRRTIRNPKSELSVKCGCSGIQGIHNGATAIVVHSGTLEFYKEFLREILI